MKCLQTKLILARLKRELAAWLGRVGAQTKAPNPNFDPLLCRKLCIDLVPSASDPLHGDAEAWGRVAARREQVGAVLAEPKVGIGR